MVKVRAKQHGYHGDKLRNPGDVFEFKGEKLPRWVKPLDGGTASVLAGETEAAPKPKPKPATEPAPKPAAVATPPQAKTPIPTGPESNGVTDALGTQPDWVAPTGDL